jgi:ABC-2 type transport system ATP-binding protein
VHLEGVTIVISTPYLDEAERCTRVGMMFRGRLIACESPNKLRAEFRATVLEAQAGDAMQARKLIETHTGVLSASTHGDVIHLLVDQPARAAELGAAWTEHGLAVQNLRVVKPRLEDVFVLAVGEQTAAARTEAKAIH